MMKSRFEPRTEYEAAVAEQIDLILNRLEEHERKLTAILLMRQTTAQGGENDKTAVG